MPSTAVLDDARHRSLGCSGQPGLVGILWCSVEQQFHAPDKYVHRRHVVPSRSSDSKIQLRTLVRVCCSMPSQCVRFVALVISEDNVRSGGALYEAKSTTRLLMHIWRTTSGCVAVVLLLFLTWQTVNPRQLGGGEGGESRATTAAGSSVMSC